MKQDNPRSPLRVSANRVIDIITVAVLLATVWFIASSRNSNDQAQSVGPPTLLPADSLVPVGQLQLVAKSGAYLPVPSVTAPTTLLLIFRSDCPACAFVRPNWLRLSDQAVQFGSSVLAVTPEPLTPDVVSYLSHGDVPVPVYVPAEPSVFFERVYARGVPTTILVTSKGELLFHRTGQLTDGDIAFLLTTIQEIASS